ncbi:serpin B10 isoform X2 [Pelodiscus sinensis]|uniref:Leukocyte elastase inhibitor n=1 Tax=Pelodiscus sinensis TaxID=13735 RepID=K7GEY0_PELSI|nr:serpin B10 isoform X2 [Pelodiscus sinensis]|eukprot:XP_006115619.1 serpin B10 isoform X2 [Pelodiscus sinensis]
MASLSASNGSFTVDLLKKLDESYSGKNIFFSSWSISSALAMTYVGAKGNTATQMAEVLHFKKTTGTGDCLQDPDNCKDEDIHSAFQALISLINKPQTSYLLKTANRLYEEQTLPFRREFVEFVQKYYHAEPQAVDFIKAAEQVRKEINSWAESQTEGKIQNLLPKGAVHANTVLVLVNAIYFKGKWKKRFLNENTSEHLFRLSKTKTKLVQMMHLQDTFSTCYLEPMKVKIVELPYVNDDLSMLILLPDDIEDKSTGLEQLERELTYENVSKWTSPEMMMMSEVELSLPRIKLEESYNLKSTLSSMGMKDAFSPGQANFTGMSEHDDLYLSQVFHKSFVEVNEEGTEAAAATGAVIVVRSSANPVQFKADHPFLFFIRHNTTMSILFFGRFCSP